MEVRRPDGHILIAKANVIGVRLRFDLYLLPNLSTTPDCYGGI
jgi:hypothetical protein